MSGPAGFLEFFILEASDYVEQLDGLLLGGGSSAPDADAVQRIARALRGTAMMAKMPSFAELAASVERVGRAIQQGTLQWEPGLSGVVVAALDDLKTLLHSARAWSPAQDQRANARAAELARYAPAQPSAGGAPRGTPAAGVTGSPFLASETSNIAAGLELLTTRAANAATASNVLGRVRALRGVAGVSEIAALAEALEGTEDAARGLESGQDALSPEGRQVLERAATHLRKLSAILRTGEDVTAQTPERLAFVGALEAWSGQSGARERVVPISDLFFPDGAPGLVAKSANPPTSASERFRLELVSLGEHLRQVVDGARRANDADSATRARRELRRALTALQAAAESFGEHEVAEFIATHVASAEHLDFLGLAAFDDLTALLLEPGAEGERLSARLRDTVHVRDLSLAIGAGFGDEEPHQTGVTERPLADVIRKAAASQQASAPAEERRAPTAATRAPAPVAAPIVSPAPAPVAQPAPPAAPPPQRRPGGEFLHQTSAAMIDSGIAALEMLESDPLALSDEVAVSIESLLYRGRAALDRAVEIRDELRAAPKDNPTALDELFDLLELARAE